MFGTLFSIEEFAINDGPGIRTTVFLKGCPLRCNWCHNPEGLSPDAEIMHLKERDVVCGRRISDEELSSMLNRDKKIFEMNEGGVTFTGGEPTMQSEFLLSVLQKIEGIHRAVETSGYCSESVFRRVLDKVELVLFDLKHSDPREHRRWTGADNSPILRNLEILKKSGRAFRIRIPLIPGVNDSRENMERCAELLEGSVNLERIELLRYHKTAGAKYSMIGREYAPAFDTEAEPMTHESVFERYNTIIL